MNRRKLLKVAGAGAAIGAASALAAPAIAQSTPPLRWRLTSSFPKSLDTLFGGAEFFCKRVAALTDNKFQIQPFAAGEIVPGLQVLDAVQKGTVECGQTASYYYVGKDPTFAFDTAIPFGFNTRQHFAWAFHGGGLELMREFYKDYDVVSFVFGGTGAQMGGWFRKEIKTPEDLRGLKFRIGGYAGQVVSRLGAVPQQIAAGEIYPALEKGTIDAAEWVGPHDDEKLGFHKVAPIYHYPGWWEGAATGTLFVNVKAWEALPALYRQALEAAATEVCTWMIAKYDTLNPLAMRRLAAGGAKLVPFPQAVLEACYKAAQALYADTVAKNPRFKKVYEHYTAFQKNQVLWFRVAENTFDNFMAVQSARAG
jgi:TRAP-type mannitol/chloroaromatic compound transport system substrate-binding protein